MTLGDLRALVAATPEGLDDTEVKVWLPGSTIRICGPTGKSPKTFFEHKGCLCVEGNVDPGSALDD